MRSIKAQLKAGDSHAHLEVAVLGRDGDVALDAVYDGGDVQGDGGDDDLSRAKKYSLSRWIKRYKGRRWHDMNAECTQRRYVPRGPKYHHESNAENYLYRKEKILQGGWWYQKKAPTFHVRITQVTTNS
jgi:hypothetical protein